MKLPLISVLLVMALAGLSRSMDVEDAVTANVLPKSHEVCGRPWGAVIVYTVRNQSQWVQVLSRYCTIRLEVSQNGRPIELRDQGRDGTKTIKPDDIIVLKPGESERLTVHIYGATMLGGEVVLLRDMEDGSVWVTGALMVPGEIDVRGTYDPSFARAQSGFASVEKDMAELAERAAGQSAEVIRNLDLPPVSITLEK